jgi:hypothetical protein
MKLLTLKQPWATLTVRGFKPVENRTWRTQYRGLVGILAGLSFDDSPHAEGLMRACLGDVGPHDFERGGVIGVAELYDVIERGPNPICATKWFTGPIGFLWRNQKAFPIIKARGSQSLVEAPPEIHRAILERMK